LVKAPLEGNDRDMAQSFQSFLKCRYGTVETLKKNWLFGYDRTNPVYDSKTGVPAYSFKKGFFNTISDFSQIELPKVERSRNDKGEGRGENFPYWTNVPFDPVWQDFAYFKEWLYTEKMNQLIKAIRTADKNHLFIYSAAQDDVPTWHPLYTLWNKGQLDADVILHGGGYVEAVTKNVKELIIEKHETVKELYQSVGLFRAFTASSQGRAKVFGMGEGGFAFESSSSHTKTQNIGELLEDQWITQLLIDNYGSGGGFTNLWDWGTMTGSTVANKKFHDHPVTKTMQTIAQALKTDTFTEQRNPKILLLANGASLHSLIKSACFNNIIALSNIMASLHYNFDIVSTDEIADGRSTSKVNINNYDAVFMPQLFQLPDRQFDNDKPLAESKDIWLILQKWINAKPHRSLCIGLLGMRNAYCAPISDLPENMLKLVGPIGVLPPQKQKFNGVFTLPDGKEIPLVSEGIPTHEVTIKNKTKSIATFLKEKEKIIGTRHQLDNGSSVYYFGFPLGMSWAHMKEEEYSGIGIDEKNTSSLAKLYKAVLEDTGISPHYCADETMTAYISDNAKIVLARQRYAENSTSEKTITSPLLAEHIYSDATTTISKQGRNTSASISFKLEDNLAKVITSVGTIQLLRDGEIKVRTVPFVNKNGVTKYKLEVIGDASLARIKHDACCQITSE
jgi:hypothetical protein